MGKLKKFSNIGKMLSRDEMKQIKGGSREICVIHIVNKALAKVATPNADIVLMP